MILIALDMVPQRIATIDADGDDGVVDVPTVGAAAGVAAVLGVSAPPGVGAAAGAATAAAVAVDPASFELEPLRIYPWSAPESTGYRPIHSLGGTIYGWKDQPTTPASSNDFDEIAELQAQAFESSSTSHYRTGFSQFCKEFAGRGWWASSLSDEPNVDGGADFETVWPNDPNPPPGDPQFIHAYTSAHDLSLVASIVIGQYALEVPLWAHTPVDTVESFGIFSPWGARYISYYRGVFAVPPQIADVPTPGYDYLAAAGGWFGEQGGFSYAWGSYMFRVQEERVPHHPLSSGGKTWVIDTGIAKQLAAIEYRAGALYQNGIGPVVLPGDPRYDDSAWWASQRTAAIERGELRVDATSPVATTSWARRVA